jgi:serine/threonine-protein kinase HipA
MDICGVAENVSRGQLLKLADQGGIGKKFANDIVDTVLEATEDITALAKNFAIRKTTIKQLRSGIDRCKQTVD